MKKLLHLALILISFLSAKAQINHELVGYWHNWNDVNAPYIQLDQVDSRYTVINLSFATPKNGTDFDMEFVPVQVSQAALIQQIQSLQNQGKKVNISIGGANHIVSLDNINEKNTFITTMGTILNTFGFDGMDIDLEGSSISVTGGTISSPIDAKIVNLIDATKSIMANYRAQNGKKMMLTMAPETAFVQGGQSAYGGIWGAYLPVIQGLKDSLDILHVQLYNSGTMYGIDNNIYTQGTADFIVAMTEAVIQGFSTAGGTFSGLPANKVSIGLPACASAAGGGYVQSASIDSAIKYLIGNGPKPGSYTLTNANGYPSLNGMMTWSINWDAVNTCGGAYDYAILYESIFGYMTPNQTNAIGKNDNIKLFPNPCSNELHLIDEDSFELNIKIYNLFGQLIYQNTINSHASIDVRDLAPSVYLIEINGKYIRFVKSND